MSVIMIEGFDHASNASMVSKGWGTVNGSQTTGRYSGSAFSINASAGCMVSFTPAATLIAGFAFKAASNVGGIFATMMDGANTQVDLRTVDPASTIRITRNGTTLGTSTATITIGIWYYIEWKVLIDPTVGTYEVRLNGVNILSATGQNTRATSNSYADTYRVSYNANPGHFDDFYLLNTSGSVNNDFLGERRVTTLFPTAAGNSTQFTPSTGSNWQNVDDSSTDDGDSTYNSSSTAGHVDLFTMGDLAATAQNVACVQTVISHRKDDAGTRTIRPKIRIGSTNYNGTSGNASSSYSMLREVMETSPATAAAWGVSEINSAEFGYELVA